jgi:hypothetical protein
MKQRIRVTQQHRRRRELGQTAANVHYHDPIGVIDDGRQSMGDGQHGSAGELLPQRRLNGRISGVVD